MNGLLQVWFIRHGETLWSLSGQHTGRTDLPLTPHGEQMARALVPLLAAQPFDQVWCSPRLRARDTCRLAGKGHASQVDEALAEWNYGDYEGLRTAEIQQRHPLWDVWQDGCPGGESPADAARRADGLIDRLSGLSGRIALFSHGQFGRMLAARWVGLPANAGRHFGIDPASIGIFGFETDHPQRPVIWRWNAGATWA